MNGERTQYKKPRCERSATLTTKLVKTSLSRSSTSKTLLWVILSGLGFITLSAIIATFLLRDTSPLVTLIECTSKLASIAVGFYYWKAKNENLHKYKQDNKIGGTDYHIGENDEE